MSILAESGAVAIGLDLIRDRPEPKSHDPADFERLSSTFQAHPSIVAITKGGSGGFAPPPALADRPLQVASADILPDADGVIRRGLLHLTEADGTKRPTLALLLAARYLAANNIPVDWPEANRMVVGGQDIGLSRPKPAAFTASMPVSTVATSSS